MTIAKSERTSGIYLVIMLFAIDAASALVLLANRTQYVALNVIGVVADLIAVGGLWSMRK